VLTLSEDGYKFDQMYTLVHEPTAQRAEGKLKLQVHLTDEYDSDRWTGYRFYQLLHDGQVIWEEDIALSRRGDDAGQRLLGYHD